MSIEYIKHIIYENREINLLLSNWIPIIMSFIPFIDSLLLVPSLLAPNPYYALKTTGPIIAVLSIVDIILIYYVIGRWARVRNLHFKRQLELVGSALNYINGFIDRDQPDLYSEFEDITHFHLDMKDEEGEVNEFLYALGPIILSLIPIIGYIAFLYVYSMLTTDIYLHERREDKLLNKLDKILVRVGFNPISFIRNRRIPNRNLILYIVLTIVTLGIFMIYWSYSINIDIKIHIMENPRWEKRLLNILQSSSL